MIEEISKQETKRFCECGCGEPVNIRHRFKYQHHYRGKKKVIEERFCYACGINKTFKDKYGIDIWYNNLPIGWMCVNCYHRIIKKDYYDEHNKYRLRFKNRQVYMGKQIRRGICSRCKKIGRTEMHHYAYITCIPWACTVELCSECHHLGIQ